MNENRRESRNLTVCMVRNASHAISETFIDAHSENLPYNVVMLSGEIATHNDVTFSPKSILGLSWWKLERIVRSEGWRWKSTQSYRYAFKKFQPKVVVAHFGIAGVRVAKACKILNIPLIVYFRGYDAFVKNLVEENLEAYKALFHQAFALIAVSKGIARRLIDLGAPAEKVTYVASGVDGSMFELGDPAGSPPVFLAMGRFVEKKAPHLTVLAFYLALRECPNIQLRMIGDGPLLPVCRDLVRALELGKSVEFLGAQPHDRVRVELRGVRSFLQHSVEAINGDREGTPNSVMEAAASGLPVVATRHEGIEDVVIEGETGFLVDERDVHAMACRIVKLATDPALAASLGQRGRAHVCENFSRKRSLRVLSELIDKAVNRSESP